MPTKKIKKDLRNISSLKLWSKNPRYIKKEDFKRLKKSIKKFGQFKPIIITSEGVIVGGNMRLRAMRELGIKKIWVSEIDVQTTSEILKISLLDNEGFGKYDEEALAELLSQETIDIPLEDYKINVGKNINLQKVLDKFAPSGEDILDDIEEPEMITCPKCGHKFEP